MKTSWSSPEISVLFTFPRSLRHPPIVCSALRANERFAPIGRRWPALLAT